MTIRLAALLAVETAGCGLWDALGNRGEGVPGDGSDDGADANAGGDGAPGSGDGDGADANAGGDGSPGSGDGGQTYPGGEPLNTELGVGAFSDSAAGGPARVISGTYIGDGATTRSIFVGFRPDVVVIKGDSAVANQHAVIRTSTMAGNASRCLFFCENPLTDRIVSLEASSFTIGNGNMPAGTAEVNTNGTTYVWVAFAAAPGEMEVGTYTGDGVDARAISVGFMPDHVLVFHADTHWPMHRYRSMPILAQSLTIDGGALLEGIQAIDAGGFEVGTAVEVNDAGQPYHYIAVREVPGRIATGSYSSDESDNRPITGVGFKPEYVMVTRESNDQSVHKAAATGDAADVTQFFGGHPDSPNRQDFIQGLLPDGFEVGTMINRTSGGGNQYFWVAFARDGF